MRSKEVQKILNETPQHIKDEVAEYANKILKKMEKITEKEKLYQELHQALQREIEMSEATKTHVTERNLLGYIMAQNATIKAQNSLLLHQQEEILNQIKKND
jgi:hypothetical protein